MKRRLAAIATLAAATTAATALAAEPDKGTVSTATPKVEWAGELTGSGTYYEAWAQDPTIECPGTPVCDPFTLTVGDAGHSVTLKLNIDRENTAGGDPGFGIRVGFPDGSYQYVQGNAGPKTQGTVKLKNLKPGDYEINTVASHVCCNPDPYRESAEATDVASAAPAPTTTGGGTQQHAPPPAPQLTVKPSKASAKKLTKTRRYRVTASTSAPLHAVTAKLLKGKTAVASAKLASLSGTKMLVLKVAKKVKKGTYTVTVSGTDDQNRVVTTGVKVKVSK
jgi:hypothetical protein